MEWFKKHKIISGILILFVILVIIGMAGGSNTSQEVGDNSSSSNTEQKGTGQKEEVKETSYKIGEDVRVGDVRWKILNVKDRGTTLKAGESKYPSSYTQPKTTEGKFVQVTVEVENLGKELKSVTNLKIVDNQGREYTPSSDVSDWIPDGEDMFILSNLNPNVKGKFTEIYAIPADAKDLKLKVGDLDLFGSKSALINLGL